MKPGALALALTLALVPAIAAAEDAKPADGAKSADAKADAKAEPKPEAKGPKPKRPPHREVPDYDGRGSEPTTAGDVAAWVPRIILFPVRLVVDYGVRRPLGWVVSRAENSKRFRRVMRALFREIEDANPLIYPVALVDFGFKSSIGARILFRRGILLPKSDVTFRVGTGGFDWWRAHVSTKSTLGALRVRTNIGANKRPDYVFYGIGSYSQPDARARFGARTATADISAAGAVVGVGEFGVHGGVSDVDFKSSTYGDEPSIEMQVMAGRIAAIPTGYGEGYRAGRLGAHVTLDTRYEGKRARSGARLDANVERVTNLEGAGDWTKFDLMVGGSLLLDPVAERKLDVRLGIQFVHPDKPMDVPFLELPSLSGNDWLRGLPAGRIHDISAAALLVDYHWPVAAWLDAHGHLGAGNVYGDNLAGFSLASLRGSFGGALTVAGIKDRQIGGSIAFGTEPMGQGFEVSSTRVLLEYSGDY